MTTSLKKYYKQDIPTIASRMRGVGLLTQEQYEYVLKNKDAINLE